MLILKKMKKSIDLLEDSYQLIDRQKRGILCEIGCGGQPLAQAIYEHEGASKAIYFSESPYNKEYQTNKFNLPEGLRSVSFEAVKHMLGYYKSNHQKDIDFIYVASFQIGGTRDQKTATHGWIGIYQNDIEKYYHLSIYDALSRVEYAELIAEQGARLLMNKPARFIDNVKILTSIETEKLEALNHFVNFKREQFLYFNNNGEMSRYEEVFREKTISLYRGSFNPPHFGHQKIKDVATVKPTFCISVDTYDKGVLNINNLLRRLEMLKKLEIDVLLCKGKYYDDLLKHLRYRYKGNVIFVLGSDTLERIIDSTPEILAEENIEWEVFQRPNMTIMSSTKNHIKIRDFDLDISSSKIKEILSNNIDDILAKEALKGLIDIKIIDDVIKNYKNPN